jgi:peptidoglycan/LPS O-acetylase OafA/YrhL
VQFVGLASYSIYLIHLTAMYYSSQLVSDLPEALGIALLIVVGTAPGMLVYVAVEKPVQRLRRKRKSRVKPGNSESAPHTVKAMASTTAGTDRSPR